MVEVFMVQVGIGDDPNSNLGDGGFVVAIMYRLWIRCDSVVFGVYRDLGTIHMI